MSNSTTRTIPPPPQARAAAKRPVCYELAGQSLSDTEFTAGRSWHVRAQNFSIAYTWAGKGETLAQENIHPGRVPPCRSWGRPGPRYRSRRREGSGPRARRGHRPRFAWRGGKDDDSAFYYRVHSPVLLIEYDNHPGIFLSNEEPEPFHVHTIMREPNGGDYGKSLLAQHYALHHA